MGVDVAAAVVGVAAPRLVVVAVVGGAVAVGHSLERTGAWGGGGGAQIIARDPATGALAGGSDPRVEGTLSLSVARSEVQQERLQCPFRVEAA